MDSPRGNAPAAQQDSTSVQGSDNTVIKAGDVGRDFIFASTLNQYTYSSSQFVTRRIDEFRPERWVNPPEACELLEILAEHRLLIIAGELEDKSDCACHLAYLLRERLQERLGENTEDKVKVLERCRSKEPQTIETAFHEETLTILLLTELSPRQFNPYTLSGLRLLLRQNNGYAILTTGHGRADWGVATGSLEDILWRELSWELYYGAELLTDFLMRQLVGSDQCLPEWLMPEGEGEPELVSGVLFREVVTRLRTPEKVRVLSEWLLRAEWPVTREALEEELSRREGDEQALEEWYRQFDSRNQLLIAGLTLLDGLPEDVVFTGLELLVETIWRSSDPNLPQFDYCDLVQFAAYFKTTETEEGLVRIQSSSRKHRELLLRVAWDLQRRRILATLPALREMIRMSAAIEVEPARNGVGTQEAKPASPSASSRAFSRSPEGTLQLHQALVESLSLVGLLSIGVIEPHFLELAADPAKSVRQLVARALSVWRDAGHQEDLFVLLHRWWAEAVKTGDQDSRIERLRRFGEDPHAAVRAAVALIVGYSARFDRANQMEPRLLSLAVSFIQDRHPRVREAAMEAVHFIVAWHFRQIEPFLRTRVLQSQDFVRSIATGAAEACRLRSEETLAILDNWRALARADKRHSSPDKVSMREHLLATVALTYGYMQFDDQEGSLRPEVVIANLRALLMEELHPFVREYAFYAIQIQAVRNFQTVVQLLQDLLAQIQLQDRPAVVDVFARTYLHQRQLLRGGDRRIQVEGNFYDVWTNSPRPLTEIEATLYGWLLDNSRPIVQQLAVDIFDRLSRTALEIAERKLPAVRPAGSGKASQATAWAGRPRPQIHPLPIAGQLAVYWVAPRKPQVRATLEPLLAEMIALQKVPPAPRRPAAASEPPQPPEVTRPPAEVLCERWSAMPNDATRAVAHLLRRAFSLYQLRWLILITILVIGFVIYKKAPEVVHKVFGSLAGSSQAVMAAPSPDVPSGNPRQPVH